MSLLNSVLANHFSFKVEAKELIVAYMMLQDVTPVPTASLPLLPVTPPTSPPMLLILQPTGLLGITWRTLHSSCGARTSWLLFSSFWNTPLTDIGDSLPHVLQTFAKRSPSQAAMSTTTMFKITPPQYSLSPWLFYFSLLLLLASALLKSLIIYVTDN